MIFAADPMAPALVPGAKGEGLSPLLQHPAMLIHPPIVFLGYAALGRALRPGGRGADVGPVEPDWLDRRGPGPCLPGRRWAAASCWGASGPTSNWLGRLLGLGPSGKRLAHALAHRHGLDPRSDDMAAGRIQENDVVAGDRDLRPVQLCHVSHPQRHLQQPACLQPVAHRLDVSLLDRGLCRRRHSIILRRKKELAAEKPLAALWSRESLVLLGILALVLLTTVILLGTLAGAISGLFSATPIMVGLAFYNNVLIPTGLVLLTVVAAVPLIRWGAGPAPGEAGS